ncbi:uncharacterized protein LOC122254976 [Penaeus japonicus]|uniref:uncharacterized protein LOC122254976 n=1 Tax=Penaeus japonicus TaxID=27405 RepID=UPI001C70FAF4|nr:uncharacterized protein LOC122254976 [Penaeus japonicus]
MRIHILVLSCVLKAVLSLYIDQGCSVKSEWREHLAWIDTHVSAWKPLDHKTDILELKVISKASDSLGKHTYDKVVVTSEEVTLTVMRMYDKTSMTYSFPQLSGEGWRDYIFSINSNYVFTSVADDASITLNVTRDLEPDYILVKGSNITLNCLSEVRIWNATGSPVFIPMSGSEQHSLSIFSKQEVIPTLRLNTATARLSYNASGITLTDEESVQRALPAFTQHNLTLDCSYGVHAAPMCVVGANNMSEKRLFMNELPRSLEITGREKDNFYILLHDHNPQANLTDPDTASSSNNLQNGIGVLMSAIVVAGLAFVTGIGLILILWQKLKTKRDVEQPDENELLIYTRHKVRQVIRKKIMIRIHVV